MNAIIELTGTGICVGLKDPERGISITRNDGTILELPLDQWETEQGAILKYLVNKVWELEKKINEH